MGDMPRGFRDEDYSETDDLATAGPEEGGVGDDLSTEMSESEVAFNEFMAMATKQKDEPAKNAAPAAAVDDEVVDSEDSAVGAAIIEAIGDGEITVEEGEEALRRWRDRDKPEKMQPSSRSALMIPINSLIVNGERRFRAR